MAIKFLLISLLFLSLLSLSSSISSKTLHEAVKTLSNSDFNAMALTLDFGHRSLTPQSRHLTIFAPSDSAFAIYGQPSLDQLNYHFTLDSLPLETLTSLPLAAKIPTFLDHHHVAVTVAAPIISLDNVSVGLPPVFDDGYLVIYGIDKFLDPDFDYEDVMKKEKSVGCVDLVNSETLVVFVLIAFASSLFVYIS